MSKLFKELVDGDIVSREEMKQEAIQRMKDIQMRNDVIDSFANGKITMSSRGNIYEVPDRKSVV